MLKTLNNLNFWYVLRNTFDHFRAFSLFRFRTLRNQVLSPERRSSVFEASQPVVCPADVKVTAATQTGPLVGNAESAPPSSAPPLIQGVDHRLRKQARLLVAGMGDAFTKLHPDIQARFAHSAREEPLRFVGTMTAIRLRPLGWLLAQLTRRSGLIPTRTGQNVAFEFNVRPLGMSWLKHRCYHFNDGPFHFSSVMTLDNQGGFVERFQGGLGMRLRLCAEGESLVFRDAGYFLHWRRWTLPLPGVLHPGRFLLVHENLDAQQFRVRLSLCHRWFGSLIEQTGVFRGGTVAPAAKGAS